MNCDPQRVMSPLSKDNACPEYLRASMSSAQAMKRRVNMKESCGVFTSKRVRLVTPTAILEAKSIKALSDILGCSHTLVSKSLHTGFVIFGGIVERVKDTNK